MGLGDSLPASFTSGWKREHGSSGIFTELDKPTSARCRDTSQP
jgi:hypothetical protein